LQRVYSPSLFPSTCLVRRVFFGTLSEIFVFFRLLPVSLGVPLLFFHYGVEAASFPLSPLTFVHRETGPFSDQLGPRFPPQIPPPRFFSCPPIRPTILAPEMRPHPFSQGFSLWEVVTVRWGPSFFPPLFDSSDRMKLSFVLFCKPPRAFCNFPRPPFPLCPCLPFAAAFLDFPPRNRSPLLRNLPWFSCGTWSRSFFVLSFKGLLGWRARFVWTSARISYLPFFASLFFFSAWPGPFPSCPF